MRPPLWFYVATTSKRVPVDRYKRSLQSESAAVTHESVVVINIVIVGVYRRRFF